MLILSSAHHAQIIAHTESGYPDEACGFLLGQVETSGAATTKTVQTVLPLPNHAARKESRFILSPSDVYKADKFARQAGQTIIGVFHSHPDAPAQPSEIDRQAAWPDYSYLIVAVHNGRAVQSVSWVLPPDETAPFVEETLCLE